MCVCACESVPRLNRSVLCSSQAHHVFLCNFFFFKNESQLRCSFMLWIVLGKKKKKKIINLSIFQAKKIAMLNCWCAYGNTKIDRHHCGKNSFSRFIATVILLISCVIGMRSFPYGSQHTHMCFSVSADSLTENINWYHFIHKERTLKKSQENRELIHKIRKNVCFIRNTGRLCHFQGENHFFHCIKFQNWGYVDTRAAAH